MSGSRRVPWIDSQSFTVLKNLDSQGKIRPLNLAGVHNIEDVEPSTLTHLNVKDLSALYKYVLIFESIAVGVSP